MKHKISAALILFVLAGCADRAAIYQTYGVHNKPSVSPCATPDCRYVRGPGEPADPVYPEYWTSPWTMYRVFNNYVDHSPPYDGRAICRRSESSVRTHSERAAHLDGG